MRNAKSSPLLVSPTAAFVTAGKPTTSPTFSRPWSQRCLEVRRVKSVGLGRPLLTYASSCTVWFYVFAGQAATATYVLTAVAGSPQGNLTMIGFAYALGEYPRRRFLHPAHTPALCPQVLRLLSPSALPPVEATSTRP